MSISLKDITYNLPSCTRCADTQEYIMNYLSKSETDTTAGNKWTVHIVDNPDQNVIDDIEKLLIKYGYVALDINYVAKDVDVEHASVLCLIEETYYIIDSYVNCRSASIRPFKFSNLRDFITLPSLEKWNNLWLCDEDEKEYSYDDTGIYLIYSFYDRNIIRGMTLNGNEL